MRYILAIALTICSIPAAFAQPAASSPALKPANRWNVDYAPNECRLLRVFGEGRDQIIFRLARGSGLEDFDVTLAGESIPKMRYLLPVTLRLMPQATEITFDGYSTQLPHRPERFVRGYDADASFLASITDSQLLEVRSGKEFSRIFELTGGRAAIGALNKCYDNLLTGWGLDAAKRAAAKVPPQPSISPGTWVTNNDYPTEALRASLSGDVAFLLVVGADGKSTDCRVVHSSGVPLLDQTTCSLISRRARFKPAQNDAGQAVTGYYVNRVRWVIPNT